MEWLILLAEESSLPTAKEGIYAGIGILLTVLLTKGGPFLTRLLNWKSGEQKTRDELAAKGYEGVIVRMDAEIQEHRRQSQERLKILEDTIEKQHSELEAMQADHATCKQEQETLRGDIRVLEYKNGEQAEEIKTQAAEIIELRRQIAILQIPAKRRRGAGGSDQVDGAKE